MTLVTPKKVILISVLLTLLLLGVILLAVTLGSVRVPFRLSIQILIQSIMGGKVSGTETEQAIILSLRFPRTILAGLVGAGLSVSGAVFQALLRNPLADPYILGVSSGAAVGAIVALLLGLSTASLGLPLVSFLGALMTVLLVLYFGRQDSPQHSTFGRGDHRLFSLRGHHVLYLRLPERGTPDDHLLADGRFQFS
jgi:iron complex transport system permease protein